MPAKPHTRLDQNPGPPVVEEPAHRAFALPGVEEHLPARRVRGAVEYSVPGTRTISK
jgi:hypothetical protein